MIYGIQNARASVLLHCSIWPTISCFSVYIMYNLGMWIYVFIINIRLEIDNILETDFERFALGSRREYMFKVW